MRKSGFRDGCPITTVLLELAPKNRGVSEAGRQAYAARIEIIKGKLIARWLFDYSYGPSRDPVYLMSMAGLAISFALKPALLTV
jgi:hypothetical protein